MQRFNEVLQELLVFELTLLYILSYQLVTGVILPKTLCKNKGEWLKLRGLLPCPAAFRATFHQSQKNARYLLALVS